jgi:FAD binding domain of DNA photolyase
LTCFPVLLHLQVFDRYLLDSDWSINTANWMWLSCSSFFYQYFRCAHVKPLFLLSQSITQRMLRSRTFQLCQLCAALGSVACVAQSTDLIAPSFAANMGHVLDRRCYSPVAFGKKTDPTGAYIRKYLPQVRTCSSRCAAISCTVSLQAPTQCNLTASALRCCVGCVRLQLAKYPDKYIYEPWTAPKAVQEKAGCIVGRDYPAPIVDHKQVLKYSIGTALCSFDCQRMRIQHDLKGQAPGFLQHPSLRNASVPDCATPRVCNAT